MKRQEILYESLEDSEIRQSVADGDISENTDFIPKDKVVEVVEFIDETESAIDDVFNALDGLTIENLEKIHEAFNAIIKLKEELY